MMICALVVDEGSESAALARGPVHPSLLNDISKLTGHEREVIRAIVDIMLGARPVQFEADGLSDPEVREKPL
jgi:hypothetical protein